MMMNTLTQMIESIGNRIQRARKEAGITQQQLADACGISRSAVALWETGDTQAIKSEHIFKAARALNKNAEWLATGAGPEQPNGVLREIIAALPDESAQQALDFILYRVERADGVIASEKIARYTAMIEAFKKDMAKRTGSN